MMNGMMNCGWLMITGGVVVYGVLILAGAALIKYLFFGDKSNRAAP